MHPVCFSVFLVVFFPGESFDYNRAFPTCQTSNRFSRRFHWATEGPPPRTSQCPPPALESASRAHPDLNQGPADPWWNQYRLGAGTWKHTYITHTIWTCNPSLLNTEQLWRCESTVENLNQTAEGVACSPIFTIQKNPKGLVSRWVWHQQALYTWMT